MPTQLRALLVDDSAVTRRLIKKSLVEARLAEFTFREAGDGLEALDLLRVEGPDIVFVDVHMPRMDGIQFLRQMRREFQPSPAAVMITAESNREALLEAFRQGSPDAFLLKPVNADRLYQGLRSLIQGIPVSSGLWKTPHADCLVTAVREVLTGSCKLEVEPEIGDLASGAEGTTLFGMMQFTGDLQWSVALRLECSAAAGIASRFAGYDISADGAELGDAVGELLNVVAGRAKRILVSRGLAVDVSLPTVICAQGLRFLVQRGRLQSDAFCFRTPLGHLRAGLSVGFSPGLIL